MSSKQFLVTTAFLPGLDRLCRSHGVDPLRLLATCDLPLNTLEPPFKLINQRKANKLINLAASSCKDPLLGLKVGAQFYLDKAGLAGALLSCQPQLFTLYPILNYLFSTLPVGARVSLLRRGRSAFHQIDYLLDETLDTRQFALMALSGTHRVMTDLYGSSWRLDKVCLQSVPEGARQGIEAHFGCPCSTSEGIVALEFADQLLFQPPMQQVKPEPSQKKWLSAALASSADLEKLISSIIEFLLQHERCSKDQVAGMLGLHPRVLSNCLRSRDTSFSTLLGQVRARLAQDLLRTTSLSVVDISTQLGYSNPPAFIRAFERWCGNTPQQWRKAQRNVPVASRQRIGFHTRSKP